MMIIKRKVFLFYIVGDDFFFKNFILRSWKIGKLKVCNDVIYFDFRDDRVLSEVFFQLLLKKDLLEYYEIIVKFVDFKKIKVNIFYIYKY